MNTLSLKRGTSLELTMMFSDDNGAPLSLVGATITSQIRDASNNLIALLPVTTFPATGVVSISVADTSTWPLGLLRADVKIFMPTGNIVQSDTFGISMVQQVTQ